MDGISVDKIEIILKLVESCERARYSNSSDYEMTNDLNTARKIFDEHGGAAAHLVRMPNGWAMGTDSPELREKGNMISMPAGRKDPMILTFSELDFDAVANRREARWTQPDPLGQRGVARHRGAASGPGGRHEAEAICERSARADRHPLE